MVSSMVSQRVQIYVVTSLYTEVAVGLFAASLQTQNWGWLHDADALILDTSFDRSQIH